MKILEKVKDVLKDTQKQPWPKGLPRPYDAGLVISLKKFLHGQELIDRQERNRATRRKQLEDYFGLEKDEY
jgi:hypothetical protein